jgi:hypothetical protein
MTKDRTIILKQVVALAVVGGAGYLLFGPFFFDIRQTGSGGIGAVSMGLTEMLVQLLILGLLVAVTWAVARVVRRRSKRLPPSSS